MDDRSWLLLAQEDPAFRLPADLAGRDRLGARDCGWVEQMRPFIRQFCPADGLVIDPFCGFGTTLLAAHLEGRRGIGVELEPARAGIARERMARAGADRQSILAGSILEAASSLPAADLVLSNIPYFGCRWPDEARASSQLYGMDSYAAFLDRIHLAFKALKPVVKEGGFLIVMAENLRVGEHFVPMAWDVARIVSERYHLVDERILLYERPSRPLDMSAIRSNRAHEYAFIAQNRSRPIDLDDARDCLREMASRFSEIVVYGSYARWLCGETLARPPSDLDLLVPYDTGLIARMSAWLQAQGFQVTRWGAPVGGAMAPLAADGAHYLRASRMRADGRLCVIDLCFEDALIDYATACAQARTIGGIRVLPSSRDAAKTG